MDEVYTYPAYLRRAGSILIVLSFAVWAVLSIVCLFDPAAPLALFLFGTAFFLAFGGLGLLFRRADRASVVLEKDGVLILRGKKRIAIPYDDVVNVSFDSRFCQCIVLHTEEGRYAIRQDLVLYPDFIASLRQRVKAMQAETGERLSVKCRPGELYISAGIFLFLSLGFAVLFIIGAFTEGTGIAAVLLFSTLLLAFAGFLLYVILTYPRQYVFDCGQIVKISLAGRKIYDPGDIADVSYGQTVRKSYSRFGSGVSYFIEINFHEKKKCIRIDQTATGFPLDRIADYVKKTYPAAERFTEVRLDKKPG